VNKFLLLSFILLLLNACSFDTKSGIWTEKKNLVLKSTKSTQIFAKEEVLKKEFNYPIAFSDHSPGWDMNIAAVALGANLIEKTISEDRTYPSVEHIMSIEPDEMKKFVASIRDLEVSLGNGIRNIDKEEMDKRDAIRRSVFTEKLVKKGTLLKDIEVEFRRPGFGIQPDKYELLIAKNSVLINDVEKNTAIKFSDLE